MGQRLDIWDDAGSPLRGRTSVSELKTALNRVSTPGSSWEVVASDAAGGNTHNNRGTSITSFNGNQYGAYWNTSLQIVLWKRATGENSPLSYSVLTGKTISDLTNNHHTIGMGVDKNGFLHINYGNQNDAINYFTMPTAESIAGSPSADKEMVAGAAPEDRVTYHSYVRDANDELFFMFRGNDDSGDDDDVYLYLYDAASLTWAAAPGTSTDGQVTLGSDGAFGTYFSRPFLERLNNRLHFCFHWRDSGSSDGDTLQYCYYDVAASEFRDSDHTALTLPISKTAGDVVDAVVDGGGLEIIIQRPTVVVDSFGRQYVCYTKDDGSSNPNVFVARKVDSSWVSTQVTNSQSNLSSATSIGIPSLLIDAFGKIYLIFKSPYNRGSLVVHESSDRGVSWGSPYGLVSFDGGLTRITNLDFEQWESSGILHFYFDAKVGEGAAQITTDSKSLYIMRWDSAAGEKPSPNIPTGIFSNDDVFVTSDGGQVILASDNGVATRSVSATGSSSLVVIDNGTTDFIASPGGMEVQNSFGSISISDSGSGATSFAPIIVARPSATTGSLNIFSAIAPANDAGGNTKACITLDARQDDATAIENRPLVEIRNNGTSFLEIGTEGSIDGLETTSPPAAVASKGRLFFQDNGAGKTQLMCQFQTGSAVEVAIEV